MASRNDGRVDADHLPGHIYKRPARISRLYGRIRFDKSLELLAHITAILGADNSGRDAALQEPERIPNRKSPIANLNGFGIAQLSRGQIMPYIDLYNGEIGLLVDTNYLGGIGSCIAIQHDLDLGGLVHNVIVRENVTLFVDNHARAQTALSGGSLVGKIKKAIKKILKWLLVLFPRTLPRTHLAVAARPTTLTAM